METNPEIKIISKTKKETPDGAVYYEVVLSNGSEWICDYRGENWKKTILPKSELSDDFLIKRFLVGKSPIKNENKK